MTEKDTSMGVQDMGIKFLEVGESQAEYTFKLACLRIEESEKSQILGQMSPASQKILAGTKWSKSGFVPSFKETDKILMKAARRTYAKTHSR